MIIIPTHASFLPPGPWYEHVDPLLVTLVSGSGLDAVELSGHSPGVVHQAQVPGNRHIISSAFQFLAPSGAQGVTLSVCLSVHSAQSALKH